MTISDKIVQAMEKDPQLPEVFLPPYWLGKELKEQFQNWDRMMAEKAEPYVTSFVTHRRVIQNQNFIKEFGITDFIEQQNKRMNLLQTMLESFDDGSCKSFYCLATTLLSLKSLDESLLKADKVIKEKSVDKDDLKSKAKIMKEILNQFAGEENQELRLRKVKK